MTPPISWIRRSWIRRAASLSALLLALLVGGHSYLRVLPVHLGPSPTRSSRSEQAQASRACESTDAATPDAPPVVITLARAETITHAPMPRRLALTSVPLPAAPYLPIGGLRAPPRL